jgi:FkbM family methyltransferase
MMHRLSWRILPPDHLVWFQVRGGVGRGLWLKLRPRTGRDCYEGNVEPGLQKVLSDWLRPKMVFYDLGANLGFFSLLGARMVGAGGAVFSFEADPEVAEQVRQNAARNAFSHVHVVNTAVWSSTGSVTFTRSDTAQSPDRGWGKVVSPTETQERTITVASTSLDEFAKSHAAPDFIKCDVEGAEFEVFNGARELIAKHGPIVACEVHSEENCSRLKRFFEDFGYSLSWFSPRHFLAVPVPKARPS